MKISTVQKKRMPLFADNTRRGQHFTAAAMQALYVRLAKRSRKNAVNGSVTSRMRHYEKSAIITWKPEVKAVRQGMRYMFGYVG